MHSEQDDKGNIQRPLQKDFRLMGDIEIIIKMQNINLIKYIAYKKNWNYKDLCKKYIQ